MPNIGTVKESTNLNDYAKAHLERVSGGLVCPICGSGKGKNRTPALKIYENHWHCFSCDSGGDIFDMAAIVEGIDPDDKASQLKAVADWAGIPIEARGEGSGRIAPTRSPKPSATPTPSRSYTEGRRREAAYIIRCRAGIEDPEAMGYLARRGLTLEEARSAGIGYDRQKKRLVIPWKGSDYYHIDRDVTGTARVKYLKPKSEDVGKQPLYNPEALKHDAIVVVEGAIDALAVELAGFEAVALGGSSYNELLATLNTKRYGGTVFIIPDNDPDTVEEKDRNNPEALTKREKTIKRAEDFMRNLKEAGIVSEILLLEGFNDPEAGLAEGGGIKDAADMLLTKPRRDALRAFLDGAHADSLAEAQERKNEAYTASLARLRVIDAADAVMDIFTLADEPETIPTGIQSLDDVLDGGLTRGVCVLGAVSSLGKTTLAVQIFDTIADTGRPILFVTIEQTAHEIIAKCLSRRMAEHGFTASTTDLMKSKNRAYWTDAKHAAFMEVCEHWSQTVAPWFHVLEGRTQPTVEDIANAARTIADHDGRAPIIAIDYLQLLKTANERDTDKQAVDRNMTALRQLAGGELKTPIFAISSLNRSSYSGIVTLDSFKESGSIEYGADVLMGLEPEGMAAELENVDEKMVKRKADKLTRDSKAELMRTCEIVILKQRMGKTPKDGIPLTFDVLGSRFIER